MSQPTARFPVTMSTTSCQLFRLKARQPARLAVKRIDSLIVGSNEHRRTGRTKSNPNESFCNGCCTSPSKPSTTAVAFATRAIGRAQIAPPLLCSWSIVLLRLAYLKNTEVHQEAQN